MKDRRSDTVEDSSSELLKKQSDAYRSGSLFRALGRVRPTP